MRLDPDDKVNSVSVLAQSEGEDHEVLQISKPTEILSIDMLLTGTTESTFAVEILR